MEQLLKDYLENNLSDAPILLVVNQISKMMGFCELYNVEYVEHTIRNATEFYGHNNLEHIKLLL